MGRCMKPQESNSLDSEIRTALNRITPMKQVLLYIALFLGDIAHRPSPYVLLDVESAQNLLSAPSVRPRSGTVTCPLGR
jgi:hypothetical protein